MWSWANQNLNNRLPVSIRFYRFSVAHTSRGDKFLVFGSHCDYTSMFDLTHRKRPTADHHPLICSKFSGNTHLARMHHSVIWVTWFGRSKALVQFGVFENLWYTQIVSRISDAKFARERSITSGLIFERNMLKCLRYLDRQRARASFEQISLQLMCIAIKILNLNHFAIYVLR